MQEYLRKHHFQYRRMPDFDSLEINTVRSAVKDCHALAKCEV